MESSVATWAKLRWSRWHQQQQVGIEYHLTAGTGDTQLHLLPKICWNSASTSAPMLKNCRACKGRHLPPFGRYCNHVTGSYCVFCDRHHDLPVGLQCSTYTDTTLGTTGTTSTTDTTSPAQSTTPGTTTVSTSAQISTNMAERSSPMLEGLGGREDPKYLAFLEDQYELSQKRSDSQTDQIVRRLEALERERTQWRSPTETLTRSLGQSAVLEGGAVGGASALHFSP